MSPLRSTNRRVVLSLALLVIALGCGAPGRPLTTGFESSSIYPDGLRLLLAPDAPSGEYWAGANVEWVGNDVRIALVRTVPGEIVPVTHPSYLHANGRRYIFIPYEHVASGTWVQEYVDVGDGMQHVGGTLWKPTVPFADQPGAPSVAASR